MQEDSVVESEVNRGSVVVSLVVELRPTGIARVVLCSGRICLPVDRVVIELQSVGNWRRVVDKREAIDVDGISRLPITSR